MSLWIEPDVIFKQGLRKELSIGEMLDIKNANKEKVSVVTVPPKHFFVSTTAKELANEIVSKKQNLKKPINDCKLLPSAALAVSKMESITVGELMKLLNIKNTSNAISCIKKVNFELFDYGLKLVYNEPFNVKKKYQDTIYQVKKIK